MTDYLQNGYQYLPAIVGPTNAYGIFMGVAGTLKVVSNPFASTQDELISCAATGAIAISKAGQLSIATLSSANDTSGVALTASKAHGFRICADSGGVALTAGNIRAGVSRMLIGTAITSGADISTYGHECLLKSIVSVNVGGNQAGVLGHYETVTGVTLTGSINVVKAGVASFLDLATTTTIPSGTVVSAFGVNPANFGGAMSGRASIIHVTTPMSGTWSCFLDVSGSTGCTQDSAAGTTGGKFLKIYINNVLYTAALVTA
jgi:hypothetical protein